LICEEKKKKQMDALESREKRETKQKRERERESDAIKIVYVNAENNFFFFAEFSIN
jgi:hypothetical protein